MSFEFPEAFATLVLLLPLVLVLRRSDRRSQETAETFHGRSPTVAYQRLRLIFAGVFVIAMTAVAARPYITYDRTASLLFVVDVSRSMQARFSCSEPTFLDRAKAVLQESVVAIPEARMGLFAFDRFAFPISQMTTDRTYLREVIERGLYSGLMLQATQTNISNALNAVALKRERLPNIYGQVSHVVLLSDGYVGGGFRRRLAEPIRMLRENNVKVSTVAVGNPIETPIADSEGESCVSRHIEMNGDKVMIPLRTDVLKFIATETGGDHFSENETARLVQVLRSELTYQELTDNLADDGPRRDSSTIFLALAILALLGYFYVPPQLAGFEWLGTRSNRIKE